MQEVVRAADVACGLSLGEYTALAFADAFRYVLPPAVSSSLVYYVSHGWAAHHPHSA